MCWAVVHLRCKQSLACSIRPLATPLARMLSISHSCSAFLHFVASHVSVESLKLLFVYSNVSPIHLPTQRLWCVLFIHILKFQNESFFSKLILFQSEFLYFISTLGYVLLLFFNFFLIWDLDMMANFEKNQIILDYQARMNLGSRKEGLDGNVWRDKQLFINYFCVSFQF